MANEPRARSVFLIWTGSYSDVQIMDVFSTREEAESWIAEWGRYCALYGSENDATIEERTLDPAWHAQRWMQAVKHGVTEAELEDRGLLSPPPWRAAS